MLAACLGPLVSYHSTALGFRGATLFMARGTTPKAGETGPGAPFALLGNGQQCCR